MNLTKPQTLIMAHNMQQAARVTDFNTFLMVDQDLSGSIVEISPTEKIFTNPKN